MAPIITSLASIIKQFGIGAVISSGAGPSPITATGGVISDYTDPGPGLVYRAHVFTSSGTFSVTAGSNNVEYLVVAGGGGGGLGANAYGGGGGAGGYRSSVSGESSGGGGSAESVLSISASPGVYTITVGAGGAGRTSPGNVSADNGVNSSISGPNITTVTSTGGGGGGSYVTAGTVGSVGGSGGSPAELAPPTASVPGTPGQGYGSGSSPATSGGGGGAGGVGFNGASYGSGGGDGGIGLRTVIAGPNYPIGTPGPGPTTGGWISGGGGGAGSVPGSGNNTGAGGAGGGGVGAIFPVGRTSSNGVYSTGGGGGGGASGPPGAVISSQSFGGSGGSGIVVVRYQIASLTATAKATGGLISFFGNKTIHTFLSSGTFATAPNWTSSPVEYVVVAGGGGGATNYGGGGGAGGYRTGTTPIGAHPVSTTIQIGAGGLQTSSPTVTNGTPSYFGTPITSAGGGGGAPDSIGGPGSGLDAGNAGGSGGGGGLDGPATLAAGTNYPGPTQQGYPGGQGQRGAGLPIGAGGGGGGAGGVGANADSGGLGGPGVQIPSTFLNPISIFGTPGPNPGSGYLAGGGSSANSAYPVQSTPNPGGGGYQTSYPSGPSTSGLENTGGGGGGGFQNPIAGNGGSGIVIIAYPS